MDEREKQLLTLHEGRVHHAYQDSRGYWTIGVGFLIDKRKGGRIPDEVIDFWLDIAIRDHRAALYKALPWAEQLDPVRRYVLLDMTFNLGVEPFDGDGFKDWPIFVNQVKTGKYQAAARNMRATLWARQVGRRAQRLADMMETGEWPQTLR